MNRFPRQFCNRLFRGNDYLNRAQKLSLEPSLELRVSCRIELLTSAKMQLSNKEYCNAKITRRLHIKH